MKSVQYNENFVENKAEAQNNVVAPETLQTYYKDAYMRERERYNAMFGILENNPPYEMPVYEKAEPAPATQNIIEEMVTKKKYKKAKKTMSAFIILFVIFFIAAAFFGVKYFGLF